MQRATRFCFYRDWGQKGKKEGFTEDKYKGLSVEDAIKKSGVKIQDTGGRDIAGAEMRRTNNTYRRCNST